MKKSKSTTLEQDIDARIKELEGQQITRAQAIQPILSHIEKTLVKAAPTIRVRNAKDFAGIAKAHESLTKTQRLCSGMDTEKVKHSGAVRIITNVKDDE